MKRVGDTLVIVRDDGDERWGYECVTGGSVNDAKTACASSEVEGLLRGYDEAGRYGKLPEVPEHRAGPNA